METIPIGNVRKYFPGNITVYRIQIESLPFHVTNVYLIFNGHLTLVDTGADAEKARRDLAEGFRIIREEFQENVRVEDVSDIVITHGHTDHFGMVGHEAFAGKTIYVHEDDSKILTDYEMRADYVQGRLDNFLKSTGVEDSLREGLIRLWKSHFRIFKPKSTEHYIINLHDNDEIIDGFKVHHTPGHSPGALCLEVGSFLFTGDHLLSRIVPIQFPRNIVGGTGLKTYRDSLEKISRLARENNLYGLPGHEEDIYPIPERVEEVKKFHEVRLRKIEEICKEEKSIYEVTVKYFGSFMSEVFAQRVQPEYNKLFALLEVSAHVEYLVAENRLKKVGEKSGVIKFKAT